MDESHLSAYAPLLIHVLLAMAIAGILIALSSLVGYRRPSRVKAQPYECGVQPTGDAREPISVKFYLVAIAFILFDAETMFLFPWAYVFREIGWFGFNAMLVFILLLAAGDIYLWKKGVFDWNR
jgi:NADH-quinone oxidoreductase subunit A